MRSSEPLARTNLLLQSCLAARRLGKPLLHVGAGLLLAGITIGLQAQVQGHADLPTAILETARAVHSLPLDEARKQLPVHMRATVSYFDCTIDVRHCALFVHDSTGSIFVAVPSSYRAALHEGSLVDIEGVSGPGEFAPIVDHPIVTLIGQGVLAYKATPVTLSELRAGLYDGQWVEMEGMVHSLVVRGGNVILHMATSEGVVSATTVVEPGGNYDRLVGATIRLHGNEAPQFNKRGQLTGVHVYFPSLAEVTILRHGPADPYQLPVQPINKLMGFVPGQAFSQRTRILGRVTLDWPGELLCVQDGTGGLCVHGSQGPQVAEGTAIEAVGFPEIADSTPSLMDAIYRVAGSSASAVQPLQLRAKEAIGGDHSGELAEITGTLISLDAGMEDEPLMVASEGVVFAARLPTAASETQRPAWKQGSKIRLTGVCVAKVDTQGTDAREGGARFASFQLMLRSPQDVVVLASPSWWNGPHTEMVLAAVALVTMVVLGWVFVLRRRVEQQTLVIRQSEERYRHLALHDSLTGLANRALLHDRLEVELARARRNSTCFAVLMLDLDKFKQVNDSLGHHVGDLLLRAAAERVQASVRKSDTVARIGGDEFVVLLPENCTANEPREVAAKIVLSMASRLDIEGHQVPLSASVGICIFPEGGETVDLLLRNVDCALYEAKALGRNCLKQYEPAPCHAAIQLPESTPGRLELPPGTWPLPAQ